MKNLTKIPGLLVLLITVNICALPVHAAGSSTEAEALHVLNRLAYGPRPGDIERVKKMGVDAYIEQQLNPQFLPLPDGLQKKLKSLDVMSQSAGSVLFDYQKALKDTSDESDAAQKKRRELVGRIMEQTAESRLYRAIESSHQLEEVMVDFWFNHFNVFNGKGLDRALVASYERDAIRPYVFGNFRDLLGATAKHPAMLFYLDNWLSTSADFHAHGKQGKGGGQKAKSSGLNENYAREVMELHTLGVDGGYTQKDVTELARMLTGWTFDPRAMVRSNQNFYFDAGRHDKGSKLWLGKSIPVRGQAEAEFALDVLAMHPSTAHHLSFKLAQYFVADKPAPALVERLAKRYLDTRGDIRAVLQTLFASAEFRDPQNAGVKYKTPYQYVVSAIRASDVNVQNVRPVLGILAQLGMPLYGSQTPDGYKNTQNAWMNPDAISRRINFATALATGRLPFDKEIEDGDKMGKKQLAKQAEEKSDRPAVMPAVSATALLQTLGPGLSGRSIEIVNGNPEALRASLILGSPDFMQH
ncbi:hypothetical protein UNDYM_3150 [Undibacterium sp. YM2]|uniref:DUF1800 domain-containing protein n=1 Tax=Undibacterium sp. YM2 TaxID=2058625 RepID=UPI001331D4E5|nr:DUF1800 domain-containing protein [Undibacterium sp. YM2]BBB67403.1 hypothetical protein UNDYM_3150 [Undibacterium sp. YM2]